MKMVKIKTKEGARDKAINFQMWQGDKSLSYLELIKWGEYFNNLANEFDLVEEFTENGII